MYETVESLYSTLGTNKTLYVNFSEIKILKMDRKINVIIS